MTAALGASRAIPPDEAPPRRLLMIEQGGRGGVADYTGALVRALVARGWQIDLATADDHLYGEIEGVSATGIFHYVRAGTRLGDAFRSRRLKRPANGLLFLLALPRLALLARRSDVVHTQGWEIPQLGVPALAVLRLAGRPVVQTAHGTFERTKRARRLRAATRAVQGVLTARTIVHTKGDLARLPPNIARHAVVIPHGEYGGLARTGGEVDRAAARAALGIGEGVHVTLMFGQLRTDKGLGDLLVALRALPQLHLLIGGQEAGALAEHREALADPALAGRITIREGFLDMAQAAQLFAASDTVALPYQVASQSGVLLLAYGFARAVVVYPVGGMAEAVVDGETGWVCARPDAAALTDSLSAAIAAGPEECLRRGRAGARLAEERYSWTAIAELTEGVYEEALADGR
jgi:glycosyltransferase involved in cell wall biosynthesis